MKRILNLAIMILLIVSFSNTYAKGQILLTKPNVMKCVSLDGAPEKIAIYRHR